MQYERYEVGAESGLDDDCCFGAIRRAHFGCEDNVILRFGFQVALCVGICS